MWQYNKGKLYSPAKFLRNWEVYCHFCLQSLQELKILMSKNLLTPTHKNWNNIMHKSKFAESVIFPFSSQSLSCRVYSFPSQPLPSQCHYYRVPAELSTPSPPTLSSSSSPVTGTSLLVVPFLHPGSVVPLVKVSLSFSLPLSLTHTHTLRSCFIYLYTVEPPNRDTMGPTVLSLPWWSNNTLKY